tara:strand:- start:3561 stop:4769 length:1209 start_codon:yes stop_codon:yes gene_type:complete
MSEVDRDPPLAEKQRMAAFEAGIGDLMAELRGDAPSGKTDGMPYKDIIDLMLDEVFLEAPAPATAAPAEAPPPPRSRRIAASKVQQGRRSFATQDMQRAVAKLSLQGPMPEPRFAPAMQGLSPSPLGHEPIAKSAPQPKAVVNKEARRLEKECNSELRKVQAFSRAQEGKRACTARILDIRWEDRRFRSCRFCLWLMTRNNGMKREFGGLYGTGLLEHSECSEAVRLLGCAARAATGHPNSHRLETASPAFWALAIVPEVCHRMRTGFVATSDEAQRRFSFQGMAATYEEMKACIDGDRIPEEFYDFAAQSLRPELDRTLGPVKYVGNHSLGSSAKVWKKKIMCLDLLLRLAGEQGLCQAVLDMRGPPQVVHERPATVAHSTQNALLSRWGHNKRPRGIVLR